MKLPHGLTAQQIRVLQEFRRKAMNELTPGDLAAISHPGGGGGEAPARELVESGFLASKGESYVLTDRARELLARPSEPAGSGSGGASAK
jgi:hypothetical protein